MITLPVTQVRRARRARWVVTASASSAPPRFAYIQGAVLARTIGSGNNALIAQAGQTPRGVSVPSWASA